MCSSPLWRQLKHNSLTGTLPTELGELTLMNEISVSENTELCGEVPADVVVSSTAGTALGESCTTDGPAQGPTTTTSGFAARGRSLLGDDGSGRFGSQQVISTLANGAEGVYATDLDGDGDMDVLSASNFDDKIAWYANDGSGGFGSQLVITTLAKYARSVYAADVDGDGDMDVLSASFEDDKLVISTVANNPLSVFVADVDGDGDMDLLSASFVDDKIAWYANDGSGGFGSQQLVISTLADNARSVYAADMDGDGDMDVLSASAWDDKIAWYANDGSGGFGDQQVISTSADHPRRVYAADVDGDGAMDVLSTSDWDDKIGWYRNTRTAAPTTGSPTGSPTTTSGFSVRFISTLADAAWSVHAADVDGDGDMDVLSASRDDDKIAWYANDGSGGFGSQQVISTLADGARSVHAADMDGDGDMDVLSASMDDAKIACQLARNVSVLLRRAPCIAVCR
ncbi:hypothetical protein CYMTET_36403 [Cymbomonas tetramitiformis]|uniref:VCBS repeat-containing protein n=1 Tax=Cymbomonas tetramitiformis TaxID=36881 RepID=A0AAE0CG44_9CHLO|nr:hypothetical protein CYMTET_36403 [Cymbomonas tetramitiformis]